MEAIEQTTRLAAPAEEVWRWHLRPGAFERLVPPDVSARVISRDPGVPLTGRATIAVRRGPLRATWVAEHEGDAAAMRFVDRQVCGPMRSWRHEHVVRPRGDGCDYHDRIEATGPWWLPSGVLRRRVAGDLAWRHARVAADLERHARFPATPLRILVTGSSGLIGTALRAYLASAGHDVVRLLRAPEPGAADAIVWDFQGPVPPLDGFDAVIHLAGANVAGRRWTAAAKRDLRASRLGPTAALAAALAAHPPRALIVASGISYYGDRRDEVAEDDACGGGFLAELARDWEAAAEPARAAGIRVAHLRLAMVLAAGGGALAKLVPAYRLGLGGRLGSGDQPVGWIALDDVLGAIEHVLHRPLAGPINLIAGWCAQREFARVLARVLHRPRLAPPAPRALLRLALGGMADEVLLSGTAARAARLIDDGFTFRNQRLEQALRSELAR
ncbi:MAG TPA: TIGR01777 family oxidoreductase [Planctomycetota bacterium]|nr:TIGR01777 family oxidoreductase [Planctomycetota bacterium]